MRVLVITGDKRFAENERFALQATAVERLVSLYMGRGNWWPSLPRERFDVITAQDPFWRGLFAFAAARRLGARLNMQVHADLSAQGLFRRELARYLLRRADSVRVVSETIKKQVERIGARAPIHILPLYVDIREFKSVVRRPHDKETILWIGRFEREKDPRRAVAVLEKVRARGIDARMIMLGTGTLEYSVRLRARGLPVEFPGWCDPKPYFEVVDVVLSTSKHESWGASMVEALAAGVPVVAPDVGVAREAGATVVPRPELAEAVTKTLQSGARGELLLHLPAKEEWVELWRKTL